MKIAEIRPKPGVAYQAGGRCEDADEVIGYGYLHVEQMTSKCYWARIEMADGRAVVMWFRSRAEIKLIAEWE